MKLSTFILVASLPAVIFTAVPQDWQRAKSPLELPIYKKTRSSLVQNINGNFRTDEDHSVRLGQFPYQALLTMIQQEPDSLFICGGTIISYRHIITAAHCLYNMSSGTAYAGLVDMSGTPGWKSELDKSQFLIYEDYNPATLYNDLALIDAEIITFSIYVLPIALPSPEDASDSLVDVSGEVSGWGITKDGGNSKVQQFNRHKIVSGSVCANVYEKIFADAMNLCLDTEPNDPICYGDDGGPLTVNMHGKKVLVGVASYGGACRMGHPSVFIRVSRYLGWIKAQTGGDVLLM